MAVLSIPTSYKEAHTLATTRRKRILGYQTRLITSNAPDSYSIRHYNTEIVVFHAPDPKTGEERIKVTCGGYFYSTTKERLNEVLTRYGYRIFQRNRVWFIESKGIETFVFNGSVTLRNGKLSVPQSLSYREAMKTKKTIKRYIDGYTNAFLYGRIAPPPGGDCFCCLAGSKAKDHFLSHFKEKYYVGSLLVNAISEHRKTVAPIIGNIICAQLYQNGDDSAKHALRAYESTVKDKVKRLLGRYLYPIFGFAGV